MESNIKENLNNIGHAAGYIEDSNLRRYIDVQIVIINKKMKNMDYSIEANLAEKYWNQLQN